MHRTTDTQTIADLHHETRHGRWATSDPKKQLSHANKRPCNADQVVNRTHRFSRAIVPRPPANQGQRRSPHSERAQRRSRISPLHKKKRFITAAAGHQKEPGCAPATGSVCTRARLTEQPGCARAGRPAKSNLAAQVAAATRNPAQRKLRTSASARLVPMRAAVRDDYLVTLHRA